jgi:hypothetical protein
MNLLKSIGALLAGFVLVVIITLPTDYLLESSGIMKQPFDHNPTLFIWFVVLYRSVYGVMGSYVTAWLAPHHPMRHAMIGGFIGLALSITGAIVMREVGPQWYPIALIVLALPTSWIGGKLFLMTLSKSS